MGFLSKKEKDEGKDGADNLHPLNQGGGTSRTAELRGMASRVTCFKVLFWPHPLTLTTHTPLIKVVEVHPLHSGGGLSKTSYFVVLSDPHPN